jgi:hypothetical protein
MTGGLATSWELSSWLRSLDLHEQVAAALSAPPGADHYEYARSLSHEQLDARLGAAKLSALVPAVWAGVEALRRQEAATGSELSAKFAADGGTFEMVGSHQETRTHKHAQALRRQAHAHTAYTVDTRTQEHARTHARTHAPTHALTHAPSPLPHAPFLVQAFGGLQTFHDGLEGLIGPPVLLNGSVRDAMAHEHVSSPDSHASFSTSNGIEGATPATEWAFVVQPTTNSSYAERDGEFRTRHPEWCRQPIPLAEMEERMETTVNARLRARGHATLDVDELIAGRLYTGPMWGPYTP